MKNNRRISPILVVVAALSLPATVASAQSFDPDHSARNAALAASPRTLEAYPWLALKAAGATTSAARPSRSTSAPAAVRNHQALAAAPRMIEEYPRLARQEAPSRATPKPAIPARLLGNAAIASSPRVIEEYPALALPETVPTTTPVFEVAPLK